MWNAWQSALYTNDTRALTQLAVAGPMLDGTLNNCALVGSCLSGATHRPTMSQLQTAVPKQRSYPLYFFSSIRTHALIKNNEGLPQEEPFLELQILTKASSTAPWKLSFDSGFDGPKGEQPVLLPFDFTNGSNGTSGSVGSYNVTPTISAFLADPTGKFSTKVSADNYLTLLAAYWQNYKLAGHAPRNSVIFAGGASSGEGKDLAEYRDGSVYAGSRSTYTFASDSPAGTWRFGVTGGYTMVCGSVLDTQTQTPVSGLLNQNSDEHNFGVPLPPGAYLKITTIAEHEVCLYPAASGPNDSWGGLVVAGGNVFYSAVTGHLASEDLIDLDTEYGVLSSELAQFNKQYNTCTASNGKSCVKSLAKNSADQFALFDNFLVTHNFLGKYGVDADALNKSARKLNMLYESISNGNETTGFISSIKQAEKDFLREFNKLFKDLSTT
jgi:hypothetical protein